MGECHSFEPVARRTFATAPYRPRECEALEPCFLPPTCVYAKAGDEPCRLGVQHHRGRKTGPGFPVVVVQCHTHGHAFTLYPLGHFPYGRTAAAPVSADGELLWSAAAAPARPAWGATLFAPAVALAQGTTPVADSHAWWFTEPPEQLGSAAALLGLTAATPARVGDAIAVALGIPGLTLRQAATEYRTVRGPAGRARVICGVLEELRPDRCLLDRLLAAGALAACWGSVARWDEGTAGPRGRVFPNRGPPAG